MENQHPVPGEPAQDICDCLSQVEREKLLANLHHALVWVGVKVPERFQVDQKTLRAEMERRGLRAEDLPPEIHLDQGIIELHELVWKLIHEKELSQAERKEIREIIEILEAREREDEDRLKGQRMSRDQARRLYDETAGVIRALLDLKDILRQREHTDAREEAIRKKVEDARRWNAFMDQVKAGPGKA
ncbi:MAG: hypothetical protein GKC10_00680 [Methanosarcinales archaeon]|nr:hypothetical protein [Methanosarcinales archaeon]